MAETPAPVPTSTTERAVTDAARNRKAAPPPGPMGTAPTSAPRRRAAVSASSSGSHDSVNSRERCVVAAVSVVVIPASLGRGQPTVERRRHNGWVSDGGEWWWRPHGDPEDTGPWWTPSSSMPSAEGSWRSPRRALRAMRTWRDSPPSWTVLALVSAVTAVLGGTIGGLVVHGAAGDHSSPRSVRLGAQP